MAKDFSMEMIFKLAKFSSRSPQDLATFFNLKILLIDCILVFASIRSNDGKNKYAFYKKYGLSALRYDGGISFQQH